MKKKYPFPLIKLENRSITIPHLVSFNKLTKKYGLSLSETDAKALIESRNESLVRHGRIEFGMGILDRIIFAFCDSPYLTQENYAETIHDLIEIFYYFKSDTFDTLDDETLIELMKTNFNEGCEGSVDLLAMKDLETMARSLREGNASFKQVREAHHCYEWEEWND